MQCLLLSEHCVLLTHNATIPNLAAVNNKIRASGKALHFFPVKLLSVIRFLIFMFLRVGREFLSGYYPTCRNAF